MPISETLTKRVGPLPLWGWGAVVVGGVGVFLILRRRSSSSTGTAAGGGLGTSTAGDGGGGGGGGGVIGTNAPSVPQPPSGSNINRPPLRDFVPIGKNEVSPRGGGGIVKPITIAPLTAEEEGRVISNTASPAIGAKIIANNLAGTIDFVSRQVENANGRAISYNYGAIGTTPSQVAEQRNAVVAALNQRGYVAGSWGGQVYAARSSEAFFRSLPADAQANLLRLINAQRKAA